MVKSNKEVARKKAIYILPRQKQKYVLFLKKIHELELNFYTIVSIRDPQRYMSVNFKKKNLIIKYFVNNSDINIYNILNNYTSSTPNGEYEINNIEKLFEILYNHYKIELIDPVPNFLKNPNLYCCDKTYRTNEALLNHIQKCCLIRYILWYEEIPKQVKQKKNNNINVTITNNFSVTNNNTFVGFRRTGDKLVSILNANQKSILFNSYSKVKDLVKFQWEHPDLRNIRIKNRSLYGSCEVFDPTSSKFEPAVTKDSIHSFVLDRLDDLDMLSHETEDEKIIERNDRYDRNYRQNDKKMNNLMKSTVLQLYDYNKQF